MYHVVIDKVSDYGEHYNHPNLRHFFEVHSLHSQNHPLHNLAWHRVSMKKFCILCSIEKLRFRIATKRYTGNLNISPNNGVDSMRIDNKG